MNGATLDRTKAAKFSRRGMTIVLSILAAQLSCADAQAVTTLWSFTGSNDGFNVYAALIQGHDGYLYGTTEGTQPQGEIAQIAPPSSSGQSGTVFRITTTGDLTNLWSFSGGANGNHPYGKLVQGSDGSFYGTTSYGGYGYSGYGQTGYGIVFRITPGGNFTNLYAFTNGSDGSYPNGGLVEGADGNLYGTTYAGGTSDYGVVFRISPGGSLTNLWSFSGPDGRGTSAGLTRGNDGNFYGVSEFGGTSVIGSVFRITPNGNLTNLYTFTDSENYGSYPTGSLVLGRDGNFYGVTGGGGTSGYGTVFRITPDGCLTNLWSFNGDDGRYPYAGLVQGSDGNFYGTTANGGDSFYGTLFRINVCGELTNLWTFSGDDGADPNAELMQANDGSFYGTTSGGGAYNQGTVFKLSVPLSPPANQISAAQITGSDVTILIPSVAGETYQLQFSTSMSPTNWVNVPGASITNCIGALLTLTNFGGASQPQGFYRFAITP